MRVWMFVGLFAALGFLASCSSTPPGELKITDLSQGTGDLAVRGATVEVHYTGWLYRSGKRGRQFETSLKGKPFLFVLGKGEVIEGWDRGIDGMRVGGKRDLIIPPQLGYGAEGSPPEIPSNATLEFEVQLVSVTK
jgi:FKBP-type peptidyl-prolyl cis-trans isomerase